MHAFLLIGNSAEHLVENAQELAKKLNAKILEYPIVKINDIRELNKLVRLTVTEPTAILCQNIENAGIEALNAFLKNLEEPQENLYFILTASSLQKVLPTIVSRCEIVKSTNLQITKSTNYEEIEKFLKMNIGEKIAYIDKIKDRGAAIEFTENLIQTLHSRLHEDGVKYIQISKLAELANKTLTRLKGNGNVNLQLTNLVINNG